MQRLVSSNWAIEASHGAANDFHNRPFPGTDSSVRTTPHLVPPEENPRSPLSPLTEPSFKPTIWIHTVDQPTFVLGSTQSEASLLDGPGARSAGYEVSGRRSGGGLVLVEPATSCWIDVLIPRLHPLWDDDIGRAFDWIGNVWAAALTSLGVPQCSVHKGELLNRPHGKVLCFAGLGPGEVLAEGSKVVGLSQRRTKQGARFQGLVISKWNPEPLLAFVLPDAIPEDLSIVDVRVGHRSITTAMLGEIPNRLVKYLDAAVEEQT